MGCTLSSMIVASGRGAFLTPGLLPFVPLFNLLILLVGNDSARLLLYHRRVPAVKGCLGAEAPVWTRE